MTTVCFHKTTALIGWLMFGLLTNMSLSNCLVLNKAFQAIFIVLSLGSFISRKYYVNATTPLNTKQFERLL